MHTFVLVLASIMLILGLVVGLSARRQLTEAGRSVPWSKLLKPTWTANEYYTSKGRGLMILSSSLLSLGALLALAALLTVR